MMPSASIHGTSLMTYDGVEIANVSHGVDLQGVSGALDGAELQLHRGRRCL